MKSKRHLMTVLVGLAMLATPMTAAAKDHDRNGVNNSHPSQSRSFNAPGRNVAPAVATGHEFRNQRGNGSWTTAPTVAANRDWRVNRNEYNGWNRGAYNYQNYGNRDYYGPAYSGVAPYYGTQSYGYAGGGSGACNAARRIRNEYVRDRNTGHPAAASDVLSRLRRAERSCGGVPFAGSGSGLLGGYGGAPAYQNYGGYNNSNYGGYNQQPYGYGGGSSMLAPLLQYIH